MEDLDLMRHDLSEALAECGQFLIEHEETFWGEKLLKLAKSRVDHHALVQSVIALFGGMGSLSDVYLHEVNGHVVADAEAALGRLDRMRSKIFDLAESLGRATR